MIEVGSIERGAEEGLEVRHGVQVDLASEVLERLEQRAGVLPGPAHREAADAPAHQQLDGVPRPLGGGEHERREEVDRALHDGIGVRRDQPADPVLAQRFDASVEPQVGVVEAVGVDGGEHVVQDRVAFLEVELDAAALAVQPREELAELDSLLGA